MVVEALAHVRKLTKEGKYYSAVEEAYYALQYAPTYLPLHIQIGELLLEQGKMDDAVNKFLIVANLYSLRGETSQGIRMLERIIKLAPLNVKMLRRLIEMHLDHGDTIQALEIYLKLAEAHYQLAELDNAHEVYSEALNLALQTKTHRSWRVKILYKQADIDMQRLDLRKAIRIFEQIRTLEPEDNNARSRLINLNFRLGQDNAAINELDSFVSLLENNGKRQEAVKFMKDMIEQLPDKLELRKRLADLYVRSGKNTDAVAQLDKIADLLMNAGNQNGAITMIKAIIALNPPNVEEYRQALLQMRE
jgi:tetratricopeptide (TPR) repeat protein